MKEIYYYFRMDYWPVLTNTLHTESEVEITDTFCLISLVSVNAINYISTRQWSRDKADKAGMALKQIQKLYQKIFSLRDEKQAIDEALLNSPSLAIFTHFTKNSDAGPSIFDSTSKSGDVHCLAVVTYYTDMKQHSVLLWLATTNENAPTEIVHFKWRTRLSTYLLCMVLKQHTWKDNSMDNSVLSVQVSTDPAGLHVSHFFQWLGFMKVVEEDNGLAMTPISFQDYILDYSTYWVRSTEEWRYLFQLYGGKLLVSNTKAKLSLFNNPTENGPKKNDFYAKFPWPAMSMKAIETCINDLPALQSLSGKSLPKKDLLFSYVKARSKSAGSIYEKD